MKKKMIAISLLLLAMLASLTGCGMSGMKDGYYTAEMAEFSNGWREYVCIQVKNDTIVSAEFNAKNESGFIKAWDNAYMENMKGITGTYPNEYTREYVMQLLEQQTDIEVDAISGASSSGSNFEKLVSAVLEQAKKGDPAVVLVE